MFMKALNVNEYNEYENSLAKFCNAICIQDCTRKFVCFVKSSPRDPRSASMYEAFPTEVTM